MFHALNKTINIEIIHLKTSFIFKVRLDSLLEDLKCLIEKHENINMLYYYLFLENINLLDSYNKFNIKKILEMGIGDWGLGIGDWAPIPNPQSPIPNPH
jgi:hypothetical protein